MESIWMGVAPSAATTRVLAMAGPGETLLRAMLRGVPAHPRAFATLLEAVALWQGAPVRAVLCADETVGSSDSPLSHAAWDEGGALYSVTFVPGMDHPRRRVGVRGVGDFRDLERLLVWEVAR
jgi:hypothetical protein